MALFTTATACQSLQVDREGIVLLGLMGKKALAWEDVQSIQVVEIMGPRKAGGFLMARKVTKILEISGEASCLHVMEPPLKSTKKEILGMLTEHAPADLKTSLSHTTEEWL